MGDQTALGRAHFLHMVPGSGWVGAGSPPPDHLRRSPHALASRGSSSAALTALLGVGGRGWRGTSLRRTPPASRADPGQGVQEQELAGIIDCKPSVLAGRQRVQNLGCSVTGCSGGTSYKNRRDVTAGIQALTCSPKDCSACQELIDRFREREENVKMGIYNTYIELLRQNGNVTKCQGDIDESRAMWLLKKVISKVVRSINRRLHEKSINTKVGTGALKELVIVLPDCVTDTVGSLVPMIEKSLNACSFQLDIEVTATYVLFRGGAVFTLLAMSKVVLQLFLLHWSL